MTDLTELALESALQEMRKAANGRGEALSIKPTQMLLGPDVIRYFGSPKAARDACLAVMARRNGSAIE